MTGGLTIIYNLAVLVATAWLFTSGFRDSIASELKPFVIPSAWLIVVIFMATHRDLHNSSDWTSRVALTLYAVYITWLASRDDDDDDRWRRRRRKLASRIRSLRGRLVVVPAGQT